MHFWWTRAFIFVVLFVWLLFLIRTKRNAMTSQYNDERSSSSQDQQKTDKQSLSYINGDNTLLVSSKISEQTSSEIESEEENVRPNEFEPDVKEDIQTVDEGNPRIPNIIHFIFISENKDKLVIPSIYQNNVESFVHFNPNWIYYFWSDESARDLIAKRVPGLLSVYDNYSGAILKAYALRYVLLYEYGGVFADFDMKCKRPLDRATMKYACILTPEPFEHSAILDKEPYLLSNAFMMCRPKHPFLKQIIEALSETAELKDVTEAVGPKFLTNQFISYNKIDPFHVHDIKNSTESNSPYFYKGEMEEDHIDAVYVANTHYFMSSYDANETSYFQTQCTNSSAYNIVNRGCNLWKTRQNTKARDQFSYTEQVWEHMYSNKDETQMVSIEHVIPQIKLYNES